MARSWNQSAAGWTVGVSAIWQRSISEDAEGGGREGDEPFAGLAEGFVFRAGHFDGEAVGEVEDNGVGPFGDAFERGGELVFGRRAGAGERAEEGGEEAEGDAVADEVGRVVGAGEIVVEAADAAGLAAGVEGANFGGEERIDAEEAGGFGGGGMVDDLAGGAGLYDVAVVDELEGVAEFEALFEGVGDEDDGGFVLGTDGAQDAI